MAPRNAARGTGRPAAPGGSTPRPAGRRSRTRGEPASVLQVGPASRQHSGEAGAGQGGTVARCKRGGPAPTHRGPPRARRGALGTPREEGFAMPAEWAPHARCWMAWPCREEAFGDGLEAARRAYAEVAQAISQFEPVTMIARPELLAQASLYCGPGIAVLPLPQDDSWTRDTGPTFLVDGKGGLAGVAWRFNGWGEAYAEYGQDAQMARRVLEHLGVRRFVSRMVLEGGAIAVDGEGTCMVCTPSILDPKRNPGITKAEAEADSDGLPRRREGRLAAERPRRRRDRRARRQRRLLRAAGRGPGAVRRRQGRPQLHQVDREPRRAAGRDGRQGPHARGPAGAAAEGAHPPRRATAHLPTSTSTSPTAAS